MEIDAGSLLMSILVSGVGFVAFSYGKKQHRLPQMVAGVTLMVFPYFVSSLWIMLLIAALVMGLMTVAIRLGA